MYPLALLLEMMFSNNKIDDDFKLMLVNLILNFEQKITNGGKMVNDGTDCFR